MKTRSLFGSLVMAAALLAGSGGNVAEHSRRTLARIRLLSSPRFEDGPPWPPFVKPGTRQRKRRRDARR